jgi:hypothetical protein
MYPIKKLKNVIPTGAEHSAAKWRNLLFRIENKRWLDFARHDST